ncbi:GroES-like protein [Panus rudis PR-1116 ss-1]|nr:GroES-like protein [Panus rudis PR-1116 ss-1]
MSVPAQQKALVLPKAHGDWELQTIDVPKPGQGEVVVKIEATALNPVDWKIKDYNFIVEEYPAVLGSDAAGTVVQLGEGVTNVAVGDKVVYHGQLGNNKLCTFQQYGIADANFLAKVPPNVSVEEASSVPVGITAAFVGLYGSDWESGGAQLTPPWAEGGRGKYAGEPIFVLGGSSSVGQYVIQLAKLSGFSPIITTVSPRNFDLVKSLGATHPVDRSLSSSAIVEEVKKIASKPVKIVYDSISLKDTQNTGYDVLASGGILVTVLSPQVDKEKIADDKKIKSTFGSPYVAPNKQIGIEFWSHAAEYLSSGDIRPNNVEVAPGGLAALPKLAERQKKGEVSATKLVVRPQETA